MTTNEQDRAGQDGVGAASANRFNRMWQLIEQVPHKTYKPEIHNAPKQVQDSSPQFCTLDCVRCGLEAELFLVQKPLAAGVTVEPLALRELRELSEQGQACHDRRDEREGNEELP